MNIKMLLARLSMAAVALSTSALLTASPAQVGAQDAPQTVEVAEELTAYSSAFTYQGRLNDNGSPANGTYDFEFSLFSAATGGTQLGSKLTRDNVSVNDGYFTVSLDFSSIAFTGDPRYLNIGVRPGNSTGGFTPLSPREAITPAPYALALPGVITKDGKVGVGTVNPQAKMHVVGDRIRLENNGKRLEMSTTGSQVDLLSDTSHLYIRTPNHFVTINPLPTDGNVYLGNLNNVTNVVGEFQTGGKKPIFFKRYKIEGAGLESDYVTDIPIADYVCDVTGTAVIDVDIQENNGGDYTILAVPHSSGRWAIRNHYHSQDDHEDAIWATMLCADTQLAERSGY